jgi:hypothetical protein
MTGIDPQYVPINYLQEYFVDKVTGFPLAAGVVTFYKDQARTIKKDIFRLAGTMPDYTYVTLANPLVLSSVGTFQDIDTGDDITVFLKPYDAAGNIELYYITVVSADTTPQFVREGVPNLTTSEVEGDILKNFVPNGQFLLHNNLPTGVVTADVTEIASGGWTYERTGGASADAISFVEYGSYTSLVPGSPVYRLRLTTDATTTTYKRLCLKFTDVNKFASADGSTQVYTFAFYAQSLGSNVPVSLLLLKNFGLNGSATVTSSPIASFTVDATMNAYQATFSFGNNTGKAIGEGSYLQLILDLPASAANALEFVDFILAPDAVTINSFPETSDREFIYESLTAPIPDPDGNDLYCPLMLTQSGLGYDHSTIGSIQQRFDTVTPAGWLPFDDSDYLTAGYNTATGIPYSRLQSVLWKSNTLMPLFGTGLNFLSAKAYTSTTNALSICTNKPATGITQHGAGTSGFTVSKICNPAAAYGLYAYVLKFGNVNWLYTVNNIAGVVYDKAVTSSSPASNIIVSNVVDADRYVSTDGVYETNAFGFGPLLPAAGSYISLWTADDPSTQINFWFKVDGSGVAPFPGGNDIEVDIKTGMGLAGVAQALSNAINGFNSSYILATAASAISAGAYLDLYSGNNTHYQPWYRKDGLGTAPTVGVAIPIDILSADTSAQVATKTITAINMYQFALPKHVNGMFLRAMDKLSGNDPDAVFRIPQQGGIGGDEPGSVQWDAVLANLIKYTDPSILGAGSSKYADATDSKPAQNHPFGCGAVVQNDNYTSYPGGRDTRPMNISVNMLIKY